MNFDEKLDRAFGLKVIFEADEIPAAPTATATASPATPPVAKAPTTQFYGLYDQTGKRVRGGFTSQADAQAYLQSNPVGKRTGQPVFPDPASVQIAPYANEKTLDVLKSVRRPEDHGWTKDEIVKAMAPYVGKVVSQYPSSKDDKEDYMQQGMLGVLKALANDKGLSPFPSHAMRYIQGAIDKYINLGGTVGGSGVAGGGGLGQKGGTTGYVVKWRGAPDEEVKSREFPSDPNAFKDYFSKTGRHPPRSLDPGFKAAVAFMKELRAAGNVVAGPIDKRGGMGSIDAPQGGEEPRETSLAGALPTRGGRTPLKIAMDREQLAQVMGAAELTPQQRKVIELTFGLDQPEAGEAGGKGEWGDVRSRLAGRHGPPESGEEARAPGTQAGKTPEEMGINPQQAIQDPEFDTESGKIEIARGPVEIARMLGISTEKVRQHRARALQKLQQAADQLGYMQLKRETEAGEEVAESSFRHISKVCAQLLCEMIVSGEINDVILG